MQPLHHFTIAKCKGVCPLQSACDIKFCCDDLFESRSSPIIPWGSRILFPKNSRGWYHLKMQMSILFVAWCLRVLWDVFKAIPDITSSYFVICVFVAMNNHMYYHQSDSDIISMSRTAIKLAGYQNVCLSMPNAMVFESHRLDGVYGGQSARNNNLTKWMSFVAAARYAELARQEQFDRKLTQLGWSSTTCYCLCITTFQTEKLSNESQQYLAATSNEVSIMAKYKIKPFDPVNIHEIAGMKWRATKIHG